MLLDYDDGERFEPRNCPRPIEMNRRPACRRETFRGLLDCGYRFLGRTLRSFGPLRFLRC